MGITKGSAGVDASSAGVQISVGISSQEQFRNSPGCRISSTGQRTIITGRAETISRPQGISSLSIGMQMEPEIMSGWLSGVMVGRFIPSKAIEVMRLGVARTESGAEPYMGIVCLSIKGN